MQIVSVNTARAERVQIHGREVLTGIGKRAREGAVPYAVLGLEGDEQADLSVHGGQAKAIYGYPREHYPFWRTVRAQARVGEWEDALLPPGAMGENLTLEGVLETELWIGDMMCFADGGMLVVSEPRFPCFKFNHAMGFAKAAKLMVESGYCGVYLAVRHEGRLQAGERFTLKPGPRQVGLLEIFRARTAGKKF